MLEAISVPVMVTPKTCQICGLAKSSTSFLPEIWLKNGIRTYINIMATNVDSENSRIVSIRNCTKSCVRAAPKIPEWERIFQAMQLTAERVVARNQDIAEATTQLDAWVDALLEKRRWLRARAQAGDGRR